MLHTAVLAAVEGQNGHAASRTETIGQLIEEGVERGEFFVHGDAQGLKGAANRCFALFFVEAVGQRSADGGGKGTRGVLIGASEGLREDFGARFVGVVGVALLAFRAIGSFLSWVDKQDETEVDAWIDEEELEEA